MKKGIFLALLVVLASDFAASQEIKSVNFIQEGEVSKLIIEADKDFLAERFHVTEDKQIILDLKNVRISPKLLRGIDTSEFPGSTVYISGYKKPGSANDIRFAIQLRDNVRSLLETNSNRIVLNIENRFGVFSANKVRQSEGSQITGAVTQATTDGVGLNIPKSTSIDDILQNLTLSGPKKYIGKRISINVKEIPLASVLNMIADTSGFNIILDQEVQKSPPLTLNLTNIPWDQALDTIMNLAKLSAVKSANILVIKTTTQLNKERKEELEASKLQEELEPMVTRVFLINYAVLADIQRVITDYLTPVPAGVQGQAPVSQARASVQLDERTNSLIVKDTAESLERIKKIIETLDTQTPQVMIEAKIVEASESYSKRIGLSRGITFGYDPIVNTTGRAESGPGFSFSSAPNAQAPGFLGMTIGVYKRLLNLDFNLQLMESESKGRVISTPRVVTQNKKAATLSSSEQTSFRVQQLATGTAPAVATFQNLSATLSLNVTPQVTNDGAIGLQIAINKSSFGDRPTPDAPPNIATRSVNTNVLVENGSTVVIGGLYSTNNQETRAGIPVLKDLPLIGWLFSTPYAPTSGKNELIIFMTPRILNQDEAGFTERQASKEDGAGGGI